MYVTSYGCILNKMRKAYWKGRREKIQRHDFLHHQSIYIYTQRQSYKVCVYIYVYADIFVWVITYADMFFVSLFFFVFLLFYIIDVVVYLYIRLLLVCISVFLCNSMFFLFADFLFFQQCVVLFLVKIGLWEKKR